MCVGEGLLHCNIYVSYYTSVDVCIWFLPQTWKTLSYYFYTHLILSPSLLLLRHPVSILPVLVESEVSQSIRSDQLLSRVRLFVTPWITARQASLSITNSQSSPRLMSIKSGIPSSHLILCRPLLLLPPIPPSIRVFSNKSTLHIRWPKYWSFSFSIIPSKEIPGLISFRMDWNIFIKKKKKTQQLSSVLTSTWIILPLYSLSLYSILSPLPVLCNSSFISIIEFFSTRIYVYLCLRAFIILETVPYVHYFYSSANCCVFMSFLLACWASSWHYFEFSTWLITILHDIKLVHGKLSFSLCDSMLLWFSWCSVGRSSVHALERANSFLM